MSYDPAWLDSMTRFVQQLRGTGAQVLVLGPIPDPQSDGAELPVGHLDDATACSPLRSVAVNDPGIAAETAAVKAGGGQYADLTELFCTAERCPAIVGNTLVYFDRVSYDVGIRRAVGTGTRCAGRPHVSPALTDAAALGGPRQFWVAVAVGVAAYLVGSVSQSMSPLLNRAASSGWTCATRRVNKRQPSPDNQHDPIQRHRREAQRKLSLPLRRLWKRSPMTCDMKARSDGAGTCDDAERPW